MIPFIKTDTSLTVVIDGKTHTISSDYKFYDDCIEALKADDINLLKQRINITETINDYVKAYQDDNGNVLSIRNSKIYYNDVVLPDYISLKLIDMYDEGFNVEPMYKFMCNLMKNPSNSAVNELYMFMECNNLPITDDGHFLAYKVVTKDFKDIYSNTYSNKVGDIVKIDRNQVNDNREVTCSHGLHFAGLSYIPHYGRENMDDIVIIVKINPMNVVSIPKDYNNAKGRCCEYMVVGIHPYAWDDDRLAQTSVVNTTKDSKYVESKDVYLPLSEIAEMYGLSENAVQKRAKRGVSFTSKQLTNGDTVYCCIDDTLERFIESDEDYDDEDYGIDIIQKSDGTIGFMTSDGMEVTKEQNIQVLTNDVGDVINWDIVENSDGTLSLAVVENEKSESEWSDFKPLDIVSKELSITRNAVQKRAKRGVTVKMKRDSNMIPMYSYLKQ